MHMAMNLQVLEVVKAAGISIYAHFLSGVHIVLLPPAGPHPLPRWRCNAMDIAACPWTFQRGSPNVSEDLLTHMGR